MLGMKDFPDKYFDLAIVDPPYNNHDAIGIKNGNKHSAKRTNYHLFDNKAPSSGYFNELKRVAKNQIVWGGNYFGLIGGAITWNKNGTAFGEAEMAICTTHNSVRIFNYTWNGMLQENMKDKEDRIHPTQKPIALYKWLLKNYAKPDFKIIDTHAGSCSSVIAFLEFGCQWIAFEIDKDYFQSASKRIENHKLQLKLAL